MKGDIKFAMDLNQFIIVTNESNIPEVSDSVLNSSMDDTRNHIDKVEHYMNLFADMLKTRGLEHDASKLQSPEKELFAYYGPILSKLTYGSDEYKENLKKMGEALKHHYSNNSHHPEHYKNGINDMNLFDILEMLADWKASTERTNKGNIKDSLGINAKRFNIDSQLLGILKNTCDIMKW